MKNRFLIDVPPPTISGTVDDSGKANSSLHMGHIFSYTQADLIASYHRMKGKDLLYPFCFDNNGLPTEKLANSIGVTDPSDIIEFSIAQSQTYSELPIH